MMRRGGATDGRRDVLARYRVPTELIWPFGVNRRERDACNLARRVLVRVGRVRTGWGTRRAELEATMDHADIRGVVTALRRSVAGLPRSSVGDHRGSMPT